MLAEPRRKQQWVLNPRVGKMYTELDGNSTFGQKILEKMGWSKGKGLGRKEDGNVDHIRVNYKNDSKGMGFKGSDGNWLENQSEFDSLLADLHCEYSPNESSEQPSNLAHKSKLSKSRLHYHRMVQGKDLSMRSKKDLQCILGINKKREADDRTEAEETAMLEDADLGIGETDDKMILSKDSVNSYFEKLKAKKSNRKMLAEATNENSSEDRGTVQKKKKKRKRKLSGAEPQTKEETPVPQVPICEISPPCDEETIASDGAVALKKKKKQKKCKKIKVAGDASSDETVHKEGKTGSDCVAVVELRSSDRRKRKLEQSENADESLPPRKSKKRQTDDNESKENLPNNVEPPMQKKLRRSRRKCNTKTELVLESHSHEMSLFELNKEWTLHNTGYFGKRVKRVHFKDEVTVFPVAKHDKVRGGALRMLSFFNNF